MQEDINEFSLSTRLSKLGRNPNEQAGFVNPPVFRGSTIVYNSLDDIEQKRARFSYGTAGLPTIENLENAWSNITGAAGTVMAPSGLGAIALAFFAVTKAGDHVLIADCAYRPARNFCTTILAKYGVEISYYDPMIGSGIKECIRKNTTAIFMEAPGSQSFEVQDVPAIVKVAREHNIKTIIDNTWATPIFFQAHSHGVDISLEAGTKYLGGHSDLLLGMVSANDSTWPSLREAYDALAMLPGPEDCFLALRGLRTMHLRLKEAERRALEIANWLKQRPEVSRVLHPALQDCPGHETWKRDFAGSSGLFSIVLREGYTKQNVAKMLDNMSIFGMGFSWGGFESLIIPFDCRSYRTATTWNPEGYTLRLQIGLEDIDDLKKDLDRGLLRLND